MRLTKKRMQRTSDRERETETARMSFQNNQVTATKIKIKVWMRIIEVQFNSSNESANTSHSKQYHNGVHGK